MSKTTPPGDGDRIAVEIRPQSIEREMHESYLLYSMSVIVSRALPDVRDGLKPSQRRILFAMYDMGLSPSSSFRKCAKIVGDTMGNFHPHGEEAIYPTLVRMTQPFNARYPLVEGHGNFGSVDGDPPGAMRYTEARLSHLGAEMLVDINKDTVEFVPNFDGRMQEPVLLPSRFPNLICNGSSGIAVGMATEMPPHNLTEVCNALALLIDNDDATLEEVMEVLSGPDFPSGGILLGTSGVRDAFEKGRGSFTLRCVSDIESDKNRNRIVITELPYQVNKARLLEHIADLVRKGTMEGISDLRDESDRHGMRVVIELKRDANPNVVLNRLYKHTPIQTTYGVINLALVNGQPRELGIIALLKAFLDHRREITRRRLQFELIKAQERAHILEGYRIALKHIDAIIELIKKSASPADAREQLMKKYKLSERQAQAILELMLQRLTGLEQKKIEDEYKALIKEIARLEDLLAHQRKQDALIKDETLALRDKHGDKRRTQIVPEGPEDLSAEQLIAARDVIVTMTTDGYIKRLPVETYQTQGRGGKGIIAATPRTEDSLAHVHVANTHDDLLFFTDRGRVFKCRVYELPPASRQARGTAVINLIPITPDERVTSTRPVSRFRKDRFLFMVTERGVIKKCSLDLFANLRKSGIIACGLRKGDSLRWVLMTDGKQSIILVTEKGHSIHFDEKDVRPMGRQAAGVRGIRLTKGDRVIGCALGKADDELLVASKHGYGKCTLISEYRIQGRGGKGIKTFEVTAKTGPVVDCKRVKRSDELLGLSANGQIIRQAVKTIRRTGRVAQGVRLIRLDEGDTLARIARVATEEEKADKEGATE